MRLLFVLPDSLPGHRYRVVLSDPRYEAAIGVEDLSALPIAQFSAAERADFVKAVSDHEHWANEQYLTVAFACAHTPIEMNSAVPPEGRA